ncbi:MAG: glycosyltransferase, partial [Eggerthella lenta]|nr:glycosyltransferase [Eggerthella lenta]
MVVSVRVPAATGGLFVVAEDETGAALPAMLGFDKAAFFGELHRALRRVRNAADEDDYRAWRESRKMEGLSGSRLDPEVSLSPLVSIVVPCYRVNERYFEEMLESVLAQSYVRWELVLVDSESESSKVPGIVERIADDRITVVPLRDNLGIVGNTNAGIQHARGEYVAFLDYDDVLEPNALEAYVQAIAEHPDAGLLYCDEDSFEVGGAFRNPVFKTDFNRDLLYSHNCITHWLMVRKDVLAETGLSDDEVNGAQDYDLSLRVSETGREIVHVPHMLYHWRVHGESTAGDNLGSKPYAHQAGKIALRRHFDRRGIPVSVEDGDGPFVYRVRYQLPDPQPSVEILIPSKDHVDVLDRCVRSILEKSAYGNYRITVIENNSMEDETFAYYRELEARSDRVRVIEWPHGFNYAKIMNFGAASTDADLLLLLNNDTEVIAPDFI